MDFDSDLCAIKTGIAVQPTKTLNSPAEHRSSPSQDLPVTFDLTFVQRATFQPKSQIRPFLLEGYYFAYVRGYRYVRPPEVLMLMGI